MSRPVSLTESRCELRRPALRSRGLRSRSLSLSRLVSRGRLRRPSRSPFWGEESPLAVAFEACSLELAVESSSASTSKPDMMNAMIILDQYRQTSIWDVVGQ